MEKGIIATPEEENVLRPYQGRGLDSFFLYRLICPHTIAKQRCWKRAGGEVMNKASDFNTWFQLKVPQNHSNSTLKSSIYGNVSAHCSQCFFKLDGQLQMFVITVY